MAAAVLAGWQGVDGHHSWVCSTCCVGGRVVDNSGASRGGLVSPSGKGDGGGGALVKVCEGLVNIKGLANNILTQGLETRPRSIPYMTSSTCSKIARISNPEVL